MFPTSIIVLFEIHQRFKGQFLNEFRVSFKLTVLIFWAKFAWKWYFSFETEKSCFRMGSWLLLNFSARGADRHWLLKKVKFLCFSECCNHWNLNILFYFSVKINHGKRVVHLFFYKQSIFDPHPENCLSFSKKSTQKIV